jgi:hypothetical protein
MIDMSTSQDNPYRSRQALLSLVMLGVLLASVGAAMLVVRGSQGPRQRGDELLRHIRSRTLEALWQDKETDIWLLAVDETGAAVGWEHITRTMADGQYAGTNRSQTPGIVSQETWRLNADATKGGYDSTARLGRASLDRTTIVFQDGMVTVQKGAQDRPVTSKAPSNYIPEGLDLLVFHLAASRGEKAVCQMVFNIAAIGRGEVNFTQVQLIPEGKNRLRLVPGMSPAGMVYEFDAQGSIQRIKYLGKGLEYRRVPHEEVLKHFRDAATPTEADPDATELAI